MINKITQLLLLICIPVISFAQPAKITDIDISSTPQSARLAFQLSDKTTIQTFFLHQPERYVVDFKETSIAMNLPKMPVALISTARIGHPDSTTLRLVFDLKKPMKIKKTLGTKKLLLDLYALSDAKPQINVILPVPKPITPVREQLRPVLVSTPQLKPFVIVVDAGHGGHDPGALGVYGTREKTVVLSIALHLAKLINQQPNMRAVLTRNGDYFVTLGNRLKLARKGKADLFVAIHADSYFNNRANGASVYALSARGATSLAARWLANRENHSELGGVDLRELEDQSLQLRSVLIDLAQTATSTDSLRLGNAILDALNDKTTLHYSRVEQAPFMVLKSPDIPSILIEIGFISNPSEEQKLRSQQYQAKMAQAVFNGIQTYVKKYSMAHL